MESLGAKQEALQGTSLLFPHNLSSGLITWVNVMKQISTCSLTLDQGKLEPAIKCLFISAESTFREKVRKKIKGLQPEYKVIKWFSFYRCFIGRKLTCFTVKNNFFFLYFTLLKRGRRRRKGGLVGFSLCELERFQRCKLNQTTQKCFLFLMSQQWRLVFSQ